MSAEIAVNNRRWYDNIRDMKLKGPWGLPVAVWAVVAVVTFVMLVLLVFGAWPIALVIFAVVVAAIGPLMAPSRTDLNFYQRRVRARAGKRSRKHANSMLRQGPAGHVPGGQTQLPGLSAASQITEWQDALGTRFGLISVPKTKHHTVVLDCNAAGFSGLDQPVIDVMIDHWAAWIGSLGESGDIVAASVIVETAPDTGHRVRREVLSDLDPSSPLSCRQAVQETVDIAAGAPSIQTWLTITFTGKPWVADAKSKALSTEQMAGEISSRLPGLLGSLKATGAGEGARAMTAQEVVDCVRVSFDPSAADDVAEAQLDPSGAGTGLSWQEVGPTSANALADRYEHDGSTSRVWYLFAPPRSKFYEDVLEPLLAPHHAIPRKRIAILYRPHSPEESAAIVDRDVRNTSWEASTKNRETAAGRRKKQVAANIENEEADGATLIRFGVIAVATVQDGDQLALASKTMMSSLAAPKRLKFRVARDCQDVAFSASLPIGLVLPEHMNVPTILRETM